MYVYDAANSLAQSIKESPEYVEFKKTREYVASVPELKEKVEEFDKLKYEIQVLTFQGEKQDDEKMQKLQDLYAILVADEKIKEYFDVEVRFNIMLADVNKIISESVQDLL